MRALVFFVLALPVAGFFGHRAYSEHRAEKALKESLCAEELNEELLAHLSRTAGNLAEGNGFGGALDAMALQHRMHDSSLAPHLPALTRMAESDELLARIHRVAAELHTQCPDVFEDEKSGQQVVAVTIMLGTSLEGR